MKGLEMALSRYEMETRLQAGERFSSNLLSNSPYPIIAVNPDTSVRRVNPALEKLTRFSGEVLIGIKPPIGGQKRASEKPRGISKGR
jgi:PAS domain-containing protein